MYMKSFTNIFTIWLDIMYLVFIEHIVYLTTFKPAVYETGGIYGKISSPILPILLCYKNFSLVFICILLVQTWESISPMFYPYYLCVLNYQ